MIPTMSTKVPRAVVQVIDDTAETLPACAHRCGANSRGLWRFAVKSAAGSAQVLRSVGSWPTAVAFGLPASTLGGEPSLDRPRRWAGGASYGRWGDSLA